MDSLATPPGTEASTPAGATILINYLEQGNVYVDAGATATDTDANGVTYNATTLIQTTIAGNADATKLLFGWAVHVDPRLTPR